MNRVNRCYSYLLLAVFVTSGCSTIIKPPMVQKIALSQKTGKEILQDEKACVSYAKKESGYIPPAKHFFYRAIYTLLLPVIALPVLALKWNSMKETDEKKAAWFKADYIFCLQNRGYYLPAENEE